MRRTVLTLALLGVGALAWGQDEKDEEKKEPPVVVGPSEPAAPGASLERTLEHGGATRTYRLHLPKAAPKGKRVPLVVCLHGAGATGLIQEALSRFDRLSDENGFAVAYPDGRKHLWVYVGSGERGDVSFIAALVDALVADGTADPRRVYCCGISNGAYLTNTLALSEFSDRFAAFAAVAGTTPKLLAKLKHARPAPYLYFHGTEDRIVGFDGVDFLTRRNSSLSAEEWVKLWVDACGCGEPKVESIPHPANDDSPSAVRSSWQGKDGLEVAFYKIIDGGHSWPGGAPQPKALLGKTCHDVDASKVMWEFFARHQLPEKK